MHAPRVHGRVLLVTNDYPPRPGGIERYLESFLRQLDPSRVIVLTHAQDGAAEYDAAHPYRVVRMQRRVLLPDRGVRLRMQRLIAAENIDTVWFGAAAPLGLLAPAAREAGAARIVASTHGHEVGWLQLPVARRLLRDIAHSVDCLTEISEFTRSHLATVTPPTVEFHRLPGAVDTELFHPDPTAGPRLRDRYDIPPVAPVVGCIARLVPRKGQDQLIRVWPEVLLHYPAARLLLVGQGPDRARLEALTHRYRVAHRVIFTGAIAGADLPWHYAGVDLFAMPVRTRHGGLDVEGLGISFLEAAACERAVIAGDSGGVGDAVRDGITAVVLDGRDDRALLTALVELLGDPQRRGAMGAAGREFVCRHYDEAMLGARLRALI